jgi:hypothetical protein
MFVLGVISKGIGKLDFFDNIGFCLCIGAWQHYWRDCGTWVRLHSCSCSSLKTIPEGLRNLTSLTTLDLYGCSSLTTLHEGFGELTSLITIDLYRLSSLTTLSDGFGNLTSLTTLYFLMFELRNIIGDIGDSYQHFDIYQFGLFSIFPLNYVQPQKGLKHNKNAFLVHFFS